MSNMMRREFIAATGAWGCRSRLLPSQQSAPRYTGNPQLKITDVQVFIVNAGRNYLYVKVSTDQGIHGWGEAYSAGPDEATAATVRDFKEWLVGKDPRNVEYLWATMYNFTRSRAGWWSTPPSAASSTHCGISRVKPRACRFTCCWEGNAATRYAATRPPTLPSRPRI